MAFSFNYFICNSPKTGTITEDGLDLWGVIPNGDGQFMEPVAEPESLPNGPLLETMATCHSLTRIEGELSGDPLDLKMFLSTNWVCLILLFVSKMCCQHNIYYICMHTTSFASFQACIYVCCNSVAA